MRLINDRYELPTSCFAIITAYVAEKKTQRASHTAGCVSIHNYKITSYDIHIVKKHNSASRWIYTIATVFSIILVSLFFWPYMWEGDFLGKWASIVTILSPVGAPSAYFVSQYEKEKTLKQIETM